MSRFEKRRVGKRSLKLKDLASLDGGKWKSAEREVVGRTAEAEEKERIYRSRGRARGREGRREGGRWRDQLTAAVGGTNRGFDCCLVLSSLQACEGRYI